MSENSKTNTSLLSATNHHGGKWVEGVNEFVTAYSGATLTVGQVVALIAGVNGVTTAAVATLAAPGHVIGVVCSAADSAGHWVKVQTKGFAEANVEGTTDVTAGDYLGVLNGESAFKKVGTAKTVNTSAVAIDAQTANSVVVVSVYLEGGGAVIA
jgi:hypothetical protein